MLNYFDHTDGFLKPFSTLDIFNGNTLEGYLCTKPDYRYGSLFLTKVNDEFTDQIIFGTPKMHYPFDRNGVYNFPIIKKFLVYSKIDGTNILAYHYTYKDKVYTTFKTRLTPVVSNSHFGRFYDLLVEYIKYNKWVMNLINCNMRCNLSFEMYGYRNPISVKYTNSLDLVLLFGVDKEANIIPNDYLDLPEDSSYLTSYEIRSAVDIKDVYIDMKQVADDNNKDDLVCEGMMFYVLTQHTNEWVQLKCKSTQIQEIHWADSAISFNSIWTTVLNAYESTDEPNMEYITTLLMEEYTNQQVAKSEQRIQKALVLAKSHVEFVCKVNTAWKKAMDNGYDVNRDKNEFLRFMSKFFEKGEMRRVASVVFKKI